MVTEEWDTSSLGKNFKPSDINRCYCGSKAALIQEGKSNFWVQCNKQDCWHGPVTNRRDKAIKIWNNIMIRWVKNGKD